MYALIAGTADETAAVSQIESVVNFSLTATVAERFRNLEVSQRGERRGKREGGLVHTAIVFSKVQLMYASLRCYTCNWSDSVIYTAPQLVKSR